MKKPLESRKDIELLVRTFYGRVLEDDLIGHFFTKVIQLNFEKHLPVMFDFWESVIFQTGNYSHNPMTKHFELDNLSKIEPVHFERWIKLWRRSVNDFFEGDKADLAKKRAKMIADLMLYKIEKRR